MVYDVPAALVLGLLALVIPLHFAWSYAHSHILALDYFTSTDDDDDVADDDEDNDDNKLLHPLSLTVNYVSVCMLCRCCVCLCINIVCLYKYRLKRTDSYRYVECI